MEFDENSEKWTFSEKKSAHRFAQIFYFCRKSYTVSLAGIFIFYRINFLLESKLQPIEGRYLASIWKCFVQRSIEESMEIATPD